MSKLQIIDLYVEVEGKEILKGVNLEMNTGEFHVIMGHYKYNVTKGQILLDGEDVLAMTVDERSRKGLFLAMQYPSEISGVTNSEFIKSAMQARLAEGEHISLFKFIRALDKAVKELKMNENLPHRYVNEGFSGGEKKRNEILQMKLLQPKFAMLDEIDSGLDVDALRIVGENVNAMKSPDFGALIITHYERLLDYLETDYVHILINGKIVTTGTKELITKIDQYGYDWVKEELGIELPEEEAPKVVSLGTCAVKKVIGNE